MTAVVHLDLGQFHHFILIHDSHLEDKIQMNTSIYT